MSEPLSNAWVAEFEQPNRENLFSRTLLLKAPVTSDYAAKEVARIYPAMPFKLFQLCRPAMKEVAA